MAGCGFMQCSQEAWAGESAAPPTWMSRLCALRASLSALSWDDSSCCFRESSARCLRRSVANCAQGEQISTSEEPGGMGTRGVLFSLRTSDILHFGPLRGHSCPPSSSPNVDLVLQLGLQDGGLRLQPALVHAGPVRSQLRPLLKENRRAYGGQRAQTMLHTHTNRTVIYGSSTGPQASTGYKYAGSFPRVRNLATISFQKEHQTSDTSAAAPPAPRPAPYL